MPHLTARAAVDESSSLTLVAFTSLSSAWASVSSVRKPGVGEGKGDHEEATRGRRRCLQRGRAGCGRGGGWLRLRPVRAGRAGEPVEQALRREWHAGGFVHSLDHRAAAQADPGDLVTMAK